TDIRPDLQVLPAKDGRVEAVIEYLWALTRGEAQFVTVIGPELFKRPSLASALARRMEFSLKLRLLSEPGVVVTDVPLLAEDAHDAPPRRAVCRILVSGAHAATMRAVNYAGTLGFEDTKAVSFAFDAEEAARLRKEWNARGIPVGLEIAQAPYRDIGEPLLRHPRAITADPDAVAVVIMPELV